MPEQPNERPEHMTKATEKSPEEVQGTVDAAINEATSKTVTFTFGRYKAKNGRWVDYEYSFLRKKLNAAQLARKIQREGLLAAYIWVIGDDQYDLMLEREADEDGITSLERAVEFRDAMDKASGLKN